MSPVILQYDSSHTPVILGQTPVTPVRLQQTGQSDSSDLRPRSWRALVNKGLRVIDTNGENKAKTTGNKGAKRGGIADTRTCAAAVRENTGGKGSREGG